MQRNITFDLIEHARVQPAAPALLLPGRTLSYRELDGLVWRCARHLHALGVRAGQVVALTFAEEIGLVLAMLAVSRLGASAYSIPRSASPSQRREMAAQARVKWLASDQPEAFDAGVAALRLERRAVEAGPGEDDSSLLAPVPAAPWLLITGSGSTGRPKLIPVSHAQGRARSELGARALGLTPADRVAALSHFDFSTSKFRLHEALWAGAACALGPWPDAAAVLQRCASDRLSVLYGTVFHAENLIASLPEDRRDALPMLRAFELTASTVSDELRRRIRKTLTPQLHVRYGINEAGPVTMAGPPAVHEVAGTVGRALAGVEIRVVDRRGQALPPATVGLVEIRTPALVDGYLDDEPATRANFRDGWFRPGDLGRLTPEGQLIFCGRADHLMIMNGINIYPAEIEQLMSSHAGVADVAVIPVRHRIHQDIPVCAVTLRAGSTWSEQDLLDHARSRLGARGPHRVLVFDRIPRNHEGKLLRADLLRLIESRLHAPRQTSADRPVTRRRQQIRHFDQLFALPEKVDWQRLDRWLDTVLDRPDTLEPPASDPPLQEAGRWLWRALLLARWLLQAGRIPVFDPPHIVSLSRHATAGWQAQAGLALVEQLPASAHGKVLAAALRLCDWAATRELTDAKLQAFHDAASQVQAQLSRLMPGGKSTLPVLRVAHELDIPFTHLGAGVFQLGWGSQACRLDRSASERDSAIGARLSQNKAITARLLRMAGLPAPEHRVVMREEAALKAARAIGWPVVVKPTDLDRGEGITLDVADETGLRSAFARAQRLSPARQVIVERQVPGCCHRLFIAQDRLLYAVKRLPMSVLADGQRSIAELVAAEVRAQQVLPPWSRSGIRPLDELAQAALAAAGLAASSVPAAGTRVALRRIESSAWGGVDEEVSAAVHPENLGIALEAARLLGLDIAGIDLITPDISQPWFENGAVINEVNYSPLLGGGEISRRQIPALLERMLPGSGRIPIEIFVGDEAAWTAASLRWQQLLAEGLRAWLSSATLTLAPSGQTRHLTGNGCYPRARALVLSADTDALVLVVPAQEFIGTELPFARVDRIVRLDGPALPAA